MTDDSEKMLEVGGAALRASRLEAKSIEQKEIRSQRSEGRRQRTDDRGRRTERNQTSEVGSRRSED